MALTDLLKNIVRPVLLSASLYAIGCGGSGGSVLPDGSTSDGNVDGKVMCMPVAETCNSIDDDCDGLVDEAVDDCHKIAFSSGYYHGEDDYGTLIEVMNADGSNRRTLIDLVGVGGSGGVWGVRPRWALEGQHIIYVHRNSDGNLNLHQLKADGSENINLTDGYDDLSTIIDVSPDGTKVSYARGQGAGSVSDMFMMNLETKEESRLTEHTSGPEFEECGTPNIGPDNSTVVYVCGPYVYKSVGGIETKITGDGSGGAHTNPIITPDGNYLNSISADFGLEQRDMDGFNIFIIPTTYDIRGGFSYDFENPGRVYTSDMRVCIIDSFLNETCSMASINLGASYDGAVASGKDGTIAFNSKDRLSEASDIFIVSSNPSELSSTLDPTNLTQNDEGIDSEHPDWSPYPL